MTAVKKYALLSLCGLTLFCARAQMPATNYDESQVPAYTLPDPLTTIAGKKVTDAETWISERRPELLSLFESEMFGIEKGVATGVSARRGLVEEASGGTLFLDELADMSLPNQAKLLRVLEEREVLRVGSARPVPVDIKVIAATNVDLRQAVARGRFREDLYYRLNVAELTLPPLRERGDDILLLARHLRGDLDGYPPFLWK